MKQDGSVGQINDGVFILFILDPGRGVRTGAVGWQGVQSATF